MTCIISADGDKFWKNDSGQLHRSDGEPAVDKINGDKYWYINGIYHRDNDLPTIELASGTKYWHVHGNLHRPGDLPAIEYSTGRKDWYLNNKPHRLGGLPAIIDDTHSSWYEYGLRHRLRALPSIIWENVIGRYESWHIYGITYEKSQIDKFNSTLVKFCRHCIKKTRLARLRKTNNIHNQLLCMPPNIKVGYSGGMDYIKMKNYFINM